MAAQHWPLSLHAMELLLEEEVQVQEEEVLEEEILEEVHEVQPVGFVMLVLVVSTSLLSAWPVAHGGLGLGAWCG